MINTSLLSLVLQGAGITVLVSLLSALFGMLLAIVFLGLQKIKFKLLSMPFEGLLVLLRGLPEIVLIFLVYYGGSQLLAEFDMELSPFGAGVTALSLIFAAYASQTLRGAIEAIPVGQWEIGRSMCLSKLTIFKDIIMPQMWRQAIPGLSNQWLTLLKDSSLVSTIGIGEIIFHTNSVIKVTHQPFTWYTIAAVLYLVISVGSSYLIKKLDVHFNKYLPQG